MRSRETLFGKMEYEDGVLIAHPNREVEFSLQDFKSILKASHAFASESDEEFYFIIDLRGEGMNSTPESREYFANNPYNKYRLADAIIIDSLPNKLIVNFFINFNKPSVPARMFNDMDSAKKWINSMKKKRRKVA